MGGQSGKAESALLSLCAIIKNNILRYIAIYHDMYHDISSMWALRGHSSLIFKYI